MTTSSSCDGCRLRHRREFLREAATLVAGSLLAAGLTPGGAAALPVRWGRAILSRDDERTYPIPTEDGATIDDKEQVILVRYQQKAYAFNLSCPHQNTALRWHPEDNQFQCPKHHSRYQPDGVFISGRATRSMDRFAVRRDGSNMVVDLDKLYRQDENPDQWTSACMTV